MPTPEANEEQNTIGGFVMINNKKNIDEFIEKIAKENNDSLMKCVVGVDTFSAADLQEDTDDR